MNAALTNDRKVINTKIIPMFEKQLDNFQKHKSNTNAYHNQQMRAYKIAIWELKKLSQAIQRRPNNRRNAKPTLGNRFRGMRNFARDETNKMKEFFGKRWNNTMRYVDRKTQNAAALARKKAENLKRAAQDWRVIPTLQSLRSLKVSRNAKRELEQIEEAAARPSGSTPSTARSVALSSVGNGSNAASGGGNNGNTASNAGSVKVPPRNSNSNKSIYGKMKSANLKNNVWGM